MMKVNQSFLAAIALVASTTTLSAASFPEMPPLNDPPLKRVSVGDFLWIDLVTNDVEKAGDFYSGLFGWTIKSISEAPGDYAIMYNGEHKVGGLTRLMGAGEDGIGTARWVGYISVADADKAVEKAVANRGRVIVAPIDLPDRGRHAIVADNAGSIVGILQSSTGDPPPRIAGRGEWGWSQLYATNISGTRKFYERVFRLDQTVDKRSGQYGGYFLVNSGDALSGLSEPPDGVPELVGWVGFVRVRDVAEKIAKAQELGGTLIVGPRRIMPGNRYAVFKDPLGGVFGVYSVIEDSGGQ